jgi:lysophospholipase L1-like esterase
MTQAQPEAFLRLGEVRPLLKTSRPVKWLFTGDSITHGALHTFGWRDYVELFAERVRFELGRGMDLVLNSAISGHTTRDLLSGFDWRIGQFRPDAVLIMIGMNDCAEARGISCDEFRANLDQLSGKIWKLGGIPVLQTTCPILPGQAPDRAPHFPAYMDAIREAAAVNKLPLVDHERFWQARASSHSYWMSNAFHPNEYGHRAFAFCLYEALGIFDPASHSCRLHLP